MSATKSGDVHDTPVGGMYVNLDYSHCACGLIRMSKDCVAYTEETMHSVHKCLTRTNDEAVVLMVRAAPIYEAALRDILARIIIGVGDPTRDVTYLAERALKEGGAK